MVMRKIQKIFLYKISLTRGEMFVCEFFDVNEKEDFVMVFI
jgi:hypothetical protein